MPTTYVAIDVETTGLDSRQDAIIELAAIKFEGSDIVEEYTTLVNPARAVPDEITRITGITQAMVDDAPSMFSVRSQARAILGDHVLVGHNIGFDMGFLREERLGLGNHCIDTLTLASILVPDAGRFGLESLAHHLQLPLPDSGQAHRAYDDAVLTIELFLALRERAEKLTLQQLEEIVQTGQRIGWSETLFFQEALQARARHAFESDELRQRGRLPRLYHPPKLDNRVPVPKEQPDALDVDLIAAMIEPGGNFSQQFAGFEYRPQQVEMLTAVIEAFNHGEHVLVEAGTGTGKSIGYLLPAAFWATQNGRRVVISTNTINLQDQLINKDIPALQRCLPFELRAAVRKGRSNYICTRLFQQMRHSGPRDDDEMTLYARVLLWLGETETGDVAELNLRTPGERLAWSRLNADNQVCSSDICAGENCPLHVTRRKAEQAHVIIVNHALLLSDVANENHILPPFADVIIDEAHHLEAAVTSGLSFRADRRSLETILDDVTKPRSGLLYDVQSRVQAEVPRLLSEALETKIDRLRALGSETADTLQDFFMSLDFFLRDQMRARSQFAEQVRLTPAVRNQDGFDEIEMTWENLNKQFRVVAKGFEEVADILAHLAESHDIADEEEMRAALLSNGRDLEEARENLDALVAEPRSDMIYWLEAFKDRVSLHAAPLHIGPLVEQHLFHAKETVVLTSATMRTAGPNARDHANFDYIKQRLHAQHTHDLAVGSPFDYKTSTLLYLVSDIPEPNQPGYQRYLEEAIIDIATALGGRTMVLFTSYGQLSQTARAIEDPLARHKIMTLAQSSGSSRQFLLDQFKKQDRRGVLLGTRSFWEGVDVPGEALQAVLIAKLPFDVPSDPIFAARSETFDSPFFEYSIPEAVLRFRQGFGRLIRRREDEGVVVILDKRVLTKRYGQMFIDALPECTVLRQRNGRLGELSLRWLNRAK